MCLMRFILLKWSVYIPSVAQIWIYLFSSRCSIKLNFISYSNIKMMAVNVDVIVSLIELSCLVNCNKVTHTQTTLSWMLRFENESFFWVGSFEWFGRVHWNVWNCATFWFTSKESLVKHKKIHSNEPIQTHLKHFQAFLVIDLLCMIRVRSKLI